MKEEQDEAMTTTAATSSTAPSNDIQWESYDGNESSGTILPSNSTICNIPVPVVQVEDVNNNANASTPLLECGTDKQQEDLNEDLVHGTDINNQKNLKRKAPNSLEGNVPSIPVDTDLNGEELLDQVSDVVLTNRTTVFAATEESIKRTRRAVPSRISWEERLAALVAYKEEHGNLQIPIRYKKNPSLGKFVHNTREQYKLFHNQCKSGYQKRCSLTEERINELNNIGFVWTTERIKKQSNDWNTRLEQLKEYKVKHGDCLVPHGYGDDPSFAEWIHRQRTAYASMIKEEKPNPLVQSRVAKLEEIGFNFTVHSDKWMDQYLMLKAYKEKHGDCQVPTHYEENPKLGRWTHTQRHQRRLKLKLYKKSSISQERIALLDDLGFNWEVRPSMEQPRATWHQRYDELVEFHTNNGNFLVSPETHPKLYRWCCEQRSRLKKLLSQPSTTFVTVELPDADDTDVGQSRRMGPDRVKLLADIGFTSNTTLSKPSISSIDPQCDEISGSKTQQANIESNGVNKAETLLLLDLESNDTNNANSGVQMHLNVQHENNTFL